MMKYKYDLILQVTKGADDIIPRVLERAYDIKIDMHYFLDKIIPYAFIEARTNNERFVQMANDGLMNIKGLERIYISTNVEK